MRARRCLSILTLLCLLLGVSLGEMLALPPRVRAANAGLWTPVPPLARARVSHTATLLASGQVLVAGVSGGDNDTAELFDPKSNTWQRAGKMVHGRQGPVAALLGDGRVLLAGGRISVPCQSNDRTTVCPADTTTAERYDPAAKTWTAAGEMRTARSFFEAARLAGGRVLVAGGLGFSPTAPPATAEAEAYDPATDRWAAVAPLLAARGGHSVTALPDGRVLVAGGLGGDTLPLEEIATAEIFDPATNRWTPAASMTTLRGPNRATLLRDGRVLVLGNPAYPSGRTVAEVYDPATNRWTATQPLGAQHVGYTLTVLADGRVLTTGGNAPDGYLPTTEIYDPTTNRWEPTASMNMGRLYHTATLLPDGQVLVTGGGSSSNVSPSGWETAERYDPNGVMSAGPRACFFETGQCVQGRFLDYWQANGGLARNGYPLSAERQEVLEDGREYTVQYFERVRLEHHPENPPPYDVLLGQFGRRTLRTQRTSPFATMPATPRPGATHFAETGHNLGGDFRDYWLANGGLAQFGYPLTEEFEETLEDGKPYRVQYFERARLERHPENAPPYDTLLGQFGRRILAENALLDGAPGFKRLYVATERVQATLGRPAGSVVTAPGATLAFEGGRMIWRGDTRQITVLCGGEGAGAIVWGFDDTWAEGQDPGGGAAPVPGRYEPTRGFGKLWRDQPGVRDCLGYALAPAETGYTLRTQPFGFGVVAGNRLVAVDTPGGRFIYAIFDTYQGGSSCIPRPDLCVPDYERYPDPSPEEGN